MTRAYCYTCRHALPLCVCGELVRIETRTRVVFIQHAEEAWNQIGTARLAHLCLPGSVLLEGDDFARDPRLDELVADPGRETVLLYPTRDAVPLAELRGAGPLNLVVVDGTWPQARTIVKHLPQLAGVRRVRIEAGQKSRYRIRIQPRAECISTIEATVRALEEVEGDGTRFRPLLDLFDRMIDRHVALATASGRTILRDLVAERARRPLPPDLEGPLERLVLVQGETLWFLPLEERETEARPPKERAVDLVHWSALRPATGERFEAVVAPTREFAEKEARYLDLRPEELRAGISRAELAARWEAFVRPGDAYVSWDYFASNALGKIVGRSLRPQVDLRSVVKNLLNRKVRRVEDALLELDLPPSAGGARCGRRLDALARIFGGLRAARLAALATAATSR